MLCVETIGKIRRRRLVQGESISAIARDLGLSRNTVKRALRSEGERFLMPAVAAIFTGKERRYNRRFLVLCNHYLVDPTARTPASGWKKGQVENQVGNVREWLFRPKLTCTDLAELNAHLAARCGTRKPGCRAAFGAVHSGLCECTSNG